MLKFILKSLRASGLMVLMAHAQAAYPEKPIKLIAATGPGGTADLLARGLGEAMSKILGQPLIVENKPGAEQLIGLHHVAQSQPADGYTAILMGLDGQALLPVLKKNLKFDPINDFVLLAGIGEGRYVLAGPGDTPLKTFNDVVKYARENPGKLNYASSGPTVQIPTLTVVKRLGLDAVHVPFPATGPYFTSLASGIVQLGILGEGNAIQLKSRVTFYAVTGKERSPLNPDIPSFGELGFPEVFGPAYGFAVRKGTPQPIIDKLTEALKIALASEEVKSFWQRANIELRNDPPDVVKNTLKTRYQAYLDLDKQGLLKRD